MTVENWFFFFFHFFVSVILNIIHLFYACSSMNVIHMHIEWTAIKCLEQKPTKYSQNGVRFAAAAHKLYRYTILNVTSIYSIFFSFCWLRLNALVLRSGITKFAEWKMLEMFGHCLTLSFTLFFSRSFDKFALIVLNSIEKRWIALKKQC